MFYKYLYAGYQLITCFNDLLPVPKKVAFEIAEMNFVIGSVLWFEFPSWE